MSRMCTLHEIAISRANKQPGIVDALTEDTPVLNIFKWVPSTHGLWNVAEKLTDINGPAFTEPDAPLPVMSSSNDLVTTDLHVMGGMLEVPSARAQKFGGALKYFSERQDHLLKEAGRAVEKQIVKDVFLKAAVKVKNLRNAGGKGDGWWIMAVRFDDLSNVGLYDPDQFDQGRLLRIDMPYGGNEHYLRGKGYENVLGYTVVYRGHFGWQLLEPERTVAAVVNIDKDNYPTVDMMDDMLADVRAEKGNTYLICGPRAKIYGINKHKNEKVHVVMGDTNQQTVIESWNGIPIITSHNINDKIRPVTSGFKE